MFPLQTHTIPTSVINFIDLQFIMLLSYYFNYYNFKIQEELLLINFSNVLKLFLYSKYIIIILLTSLFNPIGTFIYVKPTSDILTIFKFPFPPHVLIFLIANFQCVSNGYYMFQIKVILPGSFRGYYLYYKSVFFFIVFSKWVLLVYQKTVDFYIFILYPIFL